MAVCECGCGTELPEPKFPSLRRRFVNGHNARKYAGPEWIEQDRGYGTPCWIWQQTMFRTGYGAWHKDGQQRSAHRVAYEQVYGPIPSNRDLHHLCYVKACVNPAHLEIAGRRRHMRLEAEARSSLDATDVRRIRRVGKLLTQAQLAKAFGVTPTAISLILRNKTWRGV